MRYSVYKSINILSDSLVEATEFVLKNPKELMVLNDCIDAVFSIKASLDSEKESIKGNIFDTIEDFFTTMEVLVNKANNSEKCDLEIEKIYNLSKNINNFVKNELKYKFRIIFFAELGSKWDAMESVYNAFTKREDCEVGVVLAPIFRAVKYPNGEIKSDVIYEDYLTPLNIPHIPFKKYDIKKDLPDIVFTSQPYESVTPEQFWAENVAPYTRLVYLPYFTSLGITTDEDKFTQCQMPIHKLAWKVVCQSEEVKKEYSKYFENKGSNLVAMGLPKWDYVVNMDKKNIEFPKEWEKIKGKKIILGNVHYNFTSPEELKVLIQKTIEIFDDPEIGFIYRFHPMLETMFKVYYPNYLEMWEKLKKEIEDSKNVVIDRNISYDYAFRFSDLFLTGQTSMIPQYLLTKKPVVTLSWLDLEDHIKRDESDEIFIKLTKFYPTINALRPTFKLCQKILFEEDYDYKTRMEKISNILPNADGNIGKRISDYLISEILKEDNIK